MRIKKTILELIPVEVIRERDTDMLLLEELCCNRKFTDWFIKKSTGYKGKYKIEGVWHSLTIVSLGESDLAFRIDIGKEKILFLIENKLDTSFMPEQAIRYRKRGKNIIKTGECDRFYTILFAPGKYIDRNSGFDFYLEYEEVRQWFQVQKSLSERGKFKAAILDIAIERHRRGYTPIFNKATSKFRRDYYNYSKKLFLTWGCLNPERKCRGKLAL